MREDWPHLDILADKQALLGTDSRLKLIEAVLFDVRRRVEELNESVSSAEARLDLVQGNPKPPGSMNSLPMGSINSLMSGSITSLIPGSMNNSLRPNAQGKNAPGKNEFPAPPVDGSDSLHEDVEFLRHSLEDDRTKWEQEIISLQRRLDGYEESNKRFTESRRVQQSVLDSCLQRLENCEDMRISIHKLTDAEVEIRRSLEEVQHNIENCSAKQRAVCERRVEPTGANPIDGPKPATDVEPLLTGPIAKLSRDIAGASERLTSLELCMQGSALDKQDQSSADESLVKDVRRMQLAIATISRSLSKVAKDVFDMRATELTSRSTTARSLSSTITQGGTPGQSVGTPGHGLPEKSPLVQASPSAPSLSTRSPATRSPFIRPPSICPRPDRAPANQDLASNVSTSTWSGPPRNKERETPSTSSRDSPGQMVAARLAQVRARSTLSAVPEDPRSAHFGASTHRSLNDPVPADRFSLGPRLSVRRRMPAHSMKEFFVNPD